MLVAATPLSLPLDATELLFWFVYSSEGNEYMAISKEDCRCEKSLVHRLVAVKREAEGCSRNQH